MNCASGSLMSRIGLIEAAPFGSLKVTEASFFATIAAEKALPSRVVKRRKATTCWAKACVAAKSATRRMAGKEVDFMAARRWSDVVFNGLWAFDKTACAPGRDEGWTNRLRKA